MAEKITWTIKVQADGGPTISASDVLDLETYVKTSVTIAKDISAKIEFVVSPSLLAVTSTKYKDAGKFVSFTINDGAVDTKVNLDGPLLFVGAQNMELLGSKLASLTFTNPLADPVTIEVLSGKDLTP